MKIRVKQGTVICNDRIYKVGEVLDVADITAKAMIAEGAVEDMQMVAQTEEVKEEVEEVKEEVKEELNEVEVIEPSLDWTRKELNEFAVSKGVKEPEKLPSKSNVLEAIKEVK